MILGRPLSVRFFRFREVRRKVSPEKRVELLTQPTNALLGTGHFTYMPSVDHPSLRYGTHHNDEGKEIFTSPTLWKWIGSVAVFLFLASAALLLQGIAAGDSRGRMKSRLARSIHDS